jgi:hypothetical protein
MDKGTVYTGRDLRFALGQIGEQTVNVSTGKTSITQKIDLPGFFLGISWQTFELLPPEMEETLGMLAICARLRECGLNQLIVDPA